MGYFGGRGLPFFFTTIPGAEKANKTIAGNAYNFHKTAGGIYEYAPSLTATLSAAITTHRFKQSPTATATLICTQEYPTLSP
jgi:hypothetical protein